MRLVTLTAAGSAVAAAGMLALAVVVGARDLASGTCRSVPQSDTIQAVAVLGAFRGISPLACSLAANALENRWGQNHLGGADAALLDSAQSVARTWATSNDVIDDALPVLRRSLSDPDPCARRIAAELLARVGNVGLASALRSELASAGAETREAAVLALGYAPRKSNEQAIADRGHRPRCEGAPCRGMGARPHRGPSCGVAAEHSPSRRRPDRASQRGPRARIPGNQRGCTGANQCARGRPRCARPASRSGGTWKNPVIAGTDAPAEGKRQRGGQRSAITACRHFDASVARRR